MSNHKPLNIGFIRRSLIPGNGGAENVACKFIKNFTDRGHKITFFGEKCELDKSDCFKWIKVNKAVFASSRSTGFHRNCLYTLAPYRPTYDVIYSMCRTFPVDVFRVTEQIHSEWLPRAYSPMAVFNPRHMGILKLERAVFKQENTRHVVTNSNLVRNQVIDRFNYPEDKIMVVPNGVDLKKFSPVDNDEKKKLRRELKLDPIKTILLFVAANFKTKRLDCAIAALAALNFEHKDHIQLVVVGGDSAKPYEDLIRESGVKVFFAGKSPEMEKYYRAADLLYFPSPYEPFANVCLEAAACELPVLTTVQNGSSEIVDHGKSGYIVSDFTAVAEIRESIVDFLSRTEEEKTSMADEIYKVTNHYTWTKHADMLEELFCKVRDQKEHENKNR